VGECEREKKMDRVGAYEVRAIDSAEGVEAFRESDWELHVYPSTDNSSPSSNAL